MRYSLAGWFMPLHDDMHFQDDICTLSKLCNVAHALQQLQIWGKAMIGASLVLSKDVSERENVRIQERGAPCLSVCWASSQIGFLFFFRTLVYVALRWKTRKA